MFRPHLYKTPEEILHATNTAAKAERLQLERRSALAACAYMRLRTETKSTSSSTYALPQARNPRCTDISTRTPWVCYHHNTVRDIESTTSFSVPMRLLFRPESSGRAHVARAHLNSEYEPRQPAAYQKVPKLPVLPQKAYTPRESAGHVIASGSPPIHRGAQTSRVPKRNT